MTQQFLYLSGAVKPEFAQAHGRLGLMLTPRMGQHPHPGMPWAVDTGCFKHPEDFDSGRYIHWLSLLLQEQPENFLFATAPDRLADAPATLAASAPILPQIRRLGVRAALVGQDGLEDLAIPWDDFDAFFIGGSTVWKMGAGIELGVEAQARGKWVHVGRVNSWRRAERVIGHGFDSADGTILAFGSDANLPHVLNWLDRLAWQLPLALTDRERAANYRARQRGEPVPKLRPWGQMP